MRSRDLLSRHEEEDHRLVNFEESREMMPPDRAERAFAGVGIGLRWEFIREFMDRLPPCPVLEVSPENYMGRGGYFPEALGFLRARYPILSHGLTMSIGAADPIDSGYIVSLRDFIADVGAPWHSDHLCFGSVSGKILHDLLPLAFTNQTLSRIEGRIKQVQDQLGVPFAVENISFYARPGHSEMRETEFISSLCDRTGCGLMLDVNNVFVNSLNFRFDPREWLRSVPLDRVVQMHVAGHTPYDDGKGGTLVIDTHGESVCETVETLMYEAVAAIARTGRVVPVILERDQNFASLDELLGEREKLQVVYDRALRDSGLGVSNANHNAA